MVLPLSGTANVTAGLDVVGWVGPALTALNCIDGAWIALDGRIYAVKQRVDTNQLQLTRNYTGATGAVPGEIEQMSREQVSTATLNKRTADLTSQLSTLDANGRGLFYNLIGVTGDNDPGPGNVALNNASPNLVTEIYLDVLDANEGGRDVSGILDLFGTGTVLILRSLATNAFLAVRVATAPVITANYAKLAVSYLGNDSMPGAEPLAIEWRLAGADKDVDNYAANVPGLAAFDGQAAGYRVLVANDGGRAARWVKPGAGAGGWFRAGYWTGEQGIPGPYTELTFGAVTTGAAGTPASLVVVAVDPDTVRLDFTLPKGADGMGTGDMVGPESSIDGQFAAAAGASGKLLKYLSATQATAALNVLGGDSGTGGTKGLAPAPAAGDAAANKFLKANGSWATAGFPAASQAEMEAATANDKTATPGVMHHHPAVPKLTAFISGLGGSPTVTPRFNTLGTLSVSRTSAGLYTVGWTVAITNVVALVFQYDSGGNARIFSLSEINTTNLKWVTYNLAGAAADITGFYLAVFGDLP